MKNQILAQPYENLLSFVERGQYEEAAIQMRKFSDSQISKNQEFMDLKKLISFRIALKSNPHCELNFPNLEALEGDFLKAECLFTQGLYHFHRSEWQVGSECFSKAAHFYKVSQKEERAVLCLFNRYIGLKELQCWDASHCIEELKKIQVAAELLVDKRNLAAVLREKSYLYQSELKFSAAYSEALEALKIFSLHGPKSDYDLALIQAADCAIDMGDRQLAAKHLDFLIGVVDARVQFPLYFIQKRLDTELFKKLESFEIVVPFWKKKFDRRFSQEPSQFGKEPAKKYFWKLASGYLDMNNGAKVALKPKSLEGRLISLLMTANFSRHLLIEHLWPGVTDFESSDSRIYRLINRVNTKIPGLIHFDGTRYFLSSKIEIFN